MDTYWLLGTYNDSSWTLPGEAHRSLPTGGAISDDDSTSVSSATKAVVESHGGKVAARGSKLAG